MQIFTVLTQISKAFSLTPQKSRLQRSCSDCPLKRPVGWERRGAPVRLVEMDVKCPCPVGEDALLCYKAVVTAPSPTLMRNVHSALIWATWLIVVIGDRVVLRLPAVIEREREREETVDI